MLHFDSASHLAESIYASGDDGNIARQLMQSPSEHLAKGIGWYTSKTERLSASITAVYVRGIGREHGRGQAAPLAAAR